MNFLHLESLSLIWVILTFVAGACLVWWAGSRISIFANTISERTGIGKAFIGALLLGAVTSLPEVATTVTASFNNNISLAVNNIIGGVALQVAILAVADFFVKKKGVTTVLTEPVILLQGALFSFMLCYIIISALIRDAPFLGIGLWTWGILIIGLVFFYLINKFQGTEIFLEVKNPEQQEIIQQEKKGKQKAENGNPSFSNTKLYVFTFLLAIGVLAGGYFCARSADLIAKQTGLGSSFMGIFFLALATSLPELSTSISAMRIKQYELAFSDIFGTNIFDIMLIFIADIIFTEGLIMNQIQNFSIIGATLGIAVTCIFLAGIVAKPRKQFAHLGIDSIAVIVVYFAGLYLLYTMKGNG